LLLSRFEWDGSGTANDGDEKDRCRAHRSNEWMVEQMLGPEQQREKEKEKARVTKT
jgi:hypothetical protein